MSNVCCKEFTGWFKSFTKLERSLTILEAILLAVLIALLILLILHIIACSKPNDDELQITTISNSKITHQNKDGKNASVVSTAESGQSADNNSSLGNKTDINSQPTPAGNVTEPSVKCSWTPSAKTRAAVHYYEDGATRTENIQSHEVDTTPLVVSQIETTTNEATNAIVGKNITTDVFESELNTTTPFEEIEELIRAEQSDGEEAEGAFASHIIALVKLKPPKDIIFGCILTIVSDYWTLTAASCIEAIEETDSLDSFVIMENYGTDKKGPLLTVEDVLIHPLYEGKNKSYDAALLKSGTKLTKDRRTPVKMASFLDYRLLTLTQKFIIMGYGAFRSIDKTESGRRLRQAHVYKLPSRQCAAGDAAALRHLSGGRAVSRGSCGHSSGPICAGVIFSRGLPCNYCAGAPLLLPRGVLVGMLADSDQCGVSCEPAVYVNIAEVAEWIDATSHGNLIT